MSLEKIQHVVVLMMENRSFDHMFGYLSINKPATPGDKIEGLAEPYWNPNIDDQRVYTSPTARLTGDYRVDPGHHFQDVNRQIFGEPTVGPGMEPTMRGFVLDYAERPEIKEKEPKLRAEIASWVMKCFDPRKIPVLTGLAQQYAVCDHWFSSVPGPTLPNRAFAHAATSMGRVSMNPFYWSAKTIYEQLDEVGVSSRVYSFDGNTLAFMFKELFKGGGKFLGQYGDFHRDLKKKRLPQYCFLEPRFNDWHDEANNMFHMASDQHPDNNVTEGDRLIKEVYDALRKSVYWDKCLFVIVYDEHGGFFDHVKPPSGVPAPDENVKDEFDFTRLGVRVPAVLVSPYIQPGTILHDVFDHTSLIATARRILAPDLPALTNRDAWAETFEHAITGTKTRVGKAVRAKRASDMDPNTHGLATLSDQQHAQVRMAHEEDMTLPVDKRVLAAHFSGDVDLINTEQKAADYIRLVFEAKKAEL